MHVKKGMNQVHSVIEQYIIATIERVIKDMNLATRDDVKNVVAAEIIGAFGGTSTSSRNQSKETVTTRFPQIRAEKQEDWTDETDLSLESLRETSVEALSTPPIQHGAPRKRQRYNDETARKDARAKAVADSQLRKRLVTQIQEFDPEFTPVRGHPIEELEDLLYEARSAAEKVDAPKHVVSPAPRVASLPSIPAEIPLMSSSKSPLSAFYDTKEIDAVVDNINFDDDVDSDDSEASDDTDALADTDELSDDELDPEL